MKKMNPIDWVAMILLIIGGLNWGLVGAFKFDLVSTLFKGATDMCSDNTVAMIVYILVGLSAIYMLIRALMPSGTKTDPSAPTPTI